MTLRKSQVNTSNPNEIFFYMKYRNMIKITNGQWMSIKNSQREDEKMWNDKSINPCFVSFAIGGKIITFHRFFFTIEKGDVPYDPPAYESAHISDGYAGGSYISPDYSSACIIRESSLKEALHVKACSSSTSEQRQQYFDVLSAMNNLHESVVMAKDIVMNNDNPEFDTRIHLTKSDAKPIPCIVEYVDFVLSNLHNEFVCYDYSP